MVWVWPRSCTAKVNPIVPPTFYPLFKRRRGERLLPAVRQCSAAMSRVAITVACYAITTTLAVTGTVRSVRRARGSLACRTTTRAIAVAVFPFGVHLASCSQQAGQLRCANALCHAVQCRLRHAERVCCQSTLAKAASPALPWYFTPGSRISVGIFMSTPWWQVGR